MKKYQNMWRWWSYRGHQMVGGTFTTAESRSTLLKTLGIPISRNYGVTWKGEDEVGHAILDIRRSGLHFWWQNRNQQSKKLLRKTFEILTLTNKKYQRASFVTLPLTSGDLGCILDGIIEIGILTQFSKRGFRRSRLTTAYFWNWMRLNFQFFKKVHDPFTKNTCELEKNDVIFDKALQKTENTST